MECPYCGKTDSKVVDSRLAKDAITIRRRRQCLTCSDRFTTYESTQEHLLLFLIVKNTGQGSSIPNLRTVLSIVLSTLTMLSEETEKLIDKVDKVEKTQVAKQSKRTAASNKKAPAKNKSRSLTSIDRHIQPPEEGIIEGV
jgi:transcriptional repressor NrdR